MTQMGRMPLDGSVVRGGSGLTQREAGERLRREGPNELPSPEHHSFLALIGEVMHEPMFGLLLGSAALYAVIGDLGEAAVLAAFATVSVSIALIQRGRSEKVLEALRDLSSPRALVVRDGERKRIPGREVVRGDVIIVTEGDRVPADAILLEGTGVRADESLLTGESLPVGKRVALASETVPTTPGGEGLPYLYSGTLILNGTGLAGVIATGERSEIGKIGGSVRNIEAEQPRLQAQTRRMVLIFAGAGALFSVGAVLLYGLIRGDWLQGVLAGIALGMSMLPEEFPLVLAVFMVMGAWRLSRSRVLTRRASAIETLGSATVLCTDKTGTLTQNKMNVEGLWVPGTAAWNRKQSLDVLRTQEMMTLLESAVLAGEPKAPDPMERALQSLAEECCVLESHRLELTRLYPLSAARLAVTCLWSRGTGTPSLVVAKGAPEAIVEICRVGAEELRAMQEAVNRLAGEGMRVLGVACGEHGGEAPADPSAFVLKFAGLVAFGDPLRASVPEAVKECRSAGIRVVMITGDYPQTARAIARQAGIADEGVLSGAEVDALDMAGLSRRVRDVTVFARITPGQKLRIVQALKQNGEVVAMTGDGVNDAPALKAAHIGVAMGGRGTDVAREASSLVLLDDDFHSIVRAIRLGRRIYDNLRKAMAYIISIHVPIAGLALLPILLGQPLLLTPMLIAFMELIIDPACSVVLEAEPEERDVMTRPPRNPEGSLLSKSLMTWGVLQGALALAAAAAVYMGAIRVGLPDNEVRTLTFIALVSVNLTLIFSSRTLGSSMLAALARPNAALGWGLTVVAAMLVLTVGPPSVRQFFGLGAIAVEGLALCALVALALLAVLQTLKRFNFAHLKV